MRKRMSRRNVISMVVGTIGAALDVNRGQAEEAAVAGACYWRHVRSECRGGASYEYWCYRCCDFTGCRDASCEWRAVGTC